MKAALIGLCLTVLILSGCDRRPPVVLRDAMKDVVAPQAQIVWDVGNNAMDDAGKPDATKLTAAEWAQLLEAAQQLSAISSLLSDAKHVTVARPGDQLQNEGNPGAFNATQVQKLIDADRPTFAAMARSLLANSSQLVAASKAHDAQQLVDASSALVELCESCHVKFWYPPENSGK